MRHGRRRAVRDGPASSCWRTSGSGPTGRADADRYLHDYYGYMGLVADQIAASAAVDGPDGAPTSTRSPRRASDELVTFPCSPDPTQVELLAEAVGTA